jgi:hypothetical protein
MEVSKRDFELQIIQKFEKVQVGGILYAVFVLTVFIRAGKKAHNI